MAPMEIPPLESGLVFVEEPGRSAMQKLVLGADTDGETLVESRHGEDCGFVAWYGKTANQKKRAITDGETLWIDLDSPRRYRPGDGG